MQRTAGEIHHLLVRVEYLAPILNFERIGQLDAKLKATVFGNRSQPAQHGHRVVVLEIVFERDIRHYDISEFQVIMNERPDLLSPQQRRIALHERVQASFTQQVFADTLDLVGRAPMHGRESDVVGYSVWNVDVPDVWIVASDLFDNLMLAVCAIIRLVEGPLHVRLLYASEVVADAEIKDDARSVSC